MTESRICGWCKIEKSISEFYIRKDKGRSTPRNECKGCSRKKKKDKYLKNKKNIIERNKKYYEDNKDKINAYRKAYEKTRDISFQKRGIERYKIKGEEIKEKRKEYYYNNREKVIKLNTDYVERNKGKVRERQRKNHIKRKKTDIQYSIIKVLRTRVASAVKRGGYKCNKTMDLVGCTISELIIYLESKFSDGMSWDNYGFYGWHIDHKIPCASFDMTDVDEQKKCFHYSNLQPLWAVDNFKKGAKIIFKQ